MDIATLLSLQARARRNALRASRALQQERQRREEIERVLAQAPAHPPTTNRRFWENWDHPLTGERETPAHNSTVTRRS